MLGLFLFPVMLTAAPIYAGAVWGNWYPLKVTISGLVLAGGFAAAGGALMGLRRRRTAAAERGYAHPLMTRVFFGVAHGWLALAGLVTVAGWAGVYLRSEAPGDVWTYFWENVIPGGGHGAEALRYYFTALLLASPCVPFFLLADRVSRAQMTASRMLAYAIVSMGLAVSVTAIFVVLVQATRRGAM